MYLDLINLEKANSSVKKRLITGGLLTIFFITGIAGTMTGNLDKKHLTTYVPFLIPSLYIIYTGYSKFNSLKNANLYNNIFMADLDGYISLSELASKTGKTQNDVTKEINKLLTLQILKNVSLELGSMSRVVLTKSNEENQKQHQSVSVIECPSCGAKNTVRYGFYSKCEFCGSDLYKEKNKA